MSDQFINYVRLKMFLIAAGFCLLQLLSCFNSGFGDSKNSFIKNGSNDKMKIIWQGSIKENNKTVVPGFVKTSSGSFEFKWIINSDRSERLIFMEPAGSAELKLKEKRILPLVLPDGNTLLFHDWFPLLNEKKPDSICVIASVSTSDLYSVFPAVKRPPSVSISRTPNDIAWGEVFNKNGIKYIEGKTKASFGSLNLLWRKSGSGNPELVVLESPGAGELPVKESKLLLWMDEAAGLTFICQERSPLLNSGNSSYLWCVATVKTTDILAGYNLIKRVFEEKK